MPEAKQDDERGIRGGDAAARVAARLASRIERVDGHDLWRGKVDRYGVPVTKHNTRSTTVRRLLWEVANGPLPAGAKVGSCSEQPRCVRVDHVQLAGVSIAPTSSSRGPVDRSGRKGGGSVRQLAPGRWALTVTVGRHPEGNVRRAYRTVTADSRGEAAKHLATFVAEVGDGQNIAAKQLRNLTVDDAIEMYLSDHLRDEKGRDDRTVSDYRKLHRKWFAPVIGDRPVSRVDRAAIDAIFGTMNRAGLSRSRLNQAKSLYSPFFRWARRRGITSRTPMADFELPTSRYVSKERTPPEVHELCLLLSKAVQVVPDVAPVLALGAVTGMRRGELVGVRRSRIRWDEGRIIVDASIDGHRVKSTKTRQQRSFYVDADTIAMLRRHCQERDELAESAEIPLGADPFLFSLAPDCSEPMPPDYLTRRVAVLKQHSGIEDKKPETIAREDEALRLFRQAPAPRPAGRRGPSVKGGMSFAEIGERIGRSERWAAIAVDAALRREQAQERGEKLSFDGSILASRKVHPPASCSTPASTSAWSPNAKATAPKCSPSTTPNPAGPPTVEPPTTSAGSSTATTARETETTPALHASAIASAHTTRRSAWGRPFDVGSLESVTL